MTSITIAAIKAAVEGKTIWFERGIMRFFFRSKLSRAGIERDGIAYFVSSEQFVHGDGRAEPRLYSVRSVDLETGKVDTIGEFQAYKSNDAAKAALKAYLASK